MSSLVFGMKTTSARTKDVAVNFREEDLFILEQNLNPSAPSPPNSRER